MKQHIKSILTAAIMLTISGGVNVLASTAPVLDEVIVTADRTRATEDSAGAVYAGGYVGSSPAVGILGDKDYMEVPIQATSITAKAIDQVKIPNITISEAATLDPVVRSRGGNAYNDISIRGFNISPHDYFVDGIPGLMCQSSIGMNFVERLDIISGPATLTNGSSSYGKSGFGAIDLIPKKATNTPIRRFTETFSGRSSWTEALDIGQRFGADNEWGVRINADVTKGTTFREKEKMTNGNIFVDIDYNKDNNRGNFFYGHSHVKEYAPDLPLSLGKFGIPKAPKLSTNFQASWTDYSYDNDVLGLSYEHDFNKHLTWFVKGGYHDEDWYSCFESYYPTLVSDKGDFESYIEQVPIRIFRKSFITGLKGNFETGAVTHNVVASYDKQWSSGYMGDWAAGYDLTFNGNIYNNSIEKYPKPNVDQIDWDPYKKKISTGLSFVDTMEWNKWTALVGLRHQKENVEGGYHASATSPSFGLMYKFNENLSAYGNWMQGLITGQEVSKKYANKGQYLDPAKTTQRELGIKWDKGNLGGTVSYFHVNQQIAQKDPVTNILDYNGRQQNQGISFNVYGDVGEKLHLLGGMAFMDVKNIGGSYDGNRYHGTPKWNATLALDYDVTDAFSLNSRILYNSSAWADDANTKKLASWTRFDLGAKYKWMDRKYPMTLSCNIINVFGHKYWYGAGNNSVYLGTPRTAVISLSIDF